MRIALFLFIILVVNNINANDERLDAAADYLNDKLKSTQVLLIGTPNHTQYGFYHLLERFLQKALKDKSLKYIVLERSMSSNNYLQDVSTLSPGNYALGNNMALETLCGSTEWAYAGKNLIPIVQKENQKRVNKVYLRSIDGMNSDSDNSGHDLENNPIELSNCHTNKRHKSYQYVSSYNREQETVKNFKESIMAQLAPDEKAIVIYNHAHLLIGAKSCMTNFRDGKFLQEDLFSTWLGLYENETPDFSNRMKVVLIDEEDVILMNGEQYPGYNGNGILNIRQNYSKLNFVDMNDDSLIWKKTSFVNTYFFDMSFDYSKIFDGYIWLPDSKKFNFIQDDMSEYLPQICKAK